MPTQASIPLLPLTPSQPPVERRGPPRKRVLIPAVAWCEGGAEYRCVLRDISESGAKIGVPRRHRLPSRFKLVTGNRAAGFPVRLAWQRGDFAGLILDLPKPDDASPH